MFVSVPHLCFTIGKALHLYCSSLCLCSLVRLVDDDREEVAVLEREVSEPEEREM